MRAGSADCKIRSRKEIVEKRQNIDLLLGHAYKMVNNLKMRRRHSQLNRINFKVHAKCYDFAEKDDFIESQIEQSIR